MAIRGLRWLSLAIPAVLLTACSHATPQPTPRQRQLAAESNLEAAAAAEATPAALGLLHLANGASVLFIGDSWTVGYGATDRETDGWVPKASRQLGWRLTNDGANGTGYIATSKAGGNYLTRLTAMPASPPPDAVVVSGGINDLRFDTSLEPAASQLFQAIRTKWPAVKLIVLGPFAPYSAPGPDFTSTDEQISIAAGVVNAYFLSPLNESWIPLTDVSKDINVKINHPTDVGYAIIAARFTRDVTSLELQGHL